MKEDRATLASQKGIRLVKGALAVEFVVVNDTTAWRARTAMTKEPGTIAWMEEFQAGEVMVDVGANVGIYSLCAARFRGVRVFSFEPESQNYAVLNQNIHQNGLHESVTAYCAALSDRTTFDVLHLDSFSAGGSCHSFGASVSSDLQPRATIFRQGCFATTLDTVIAQRAIPVPQHIKVDVDGFEHLVIRGADVTLRDPGVKSVLIEINTTLDEHWEIVDGMMARGFRYDAAEAERARRTTGPFKGTGNYIFRR